MKKGIKIVAILIAAVLALQLTAFAGSQSVSNGSDYITCQAGTGFQYLWGSITSNVPLQKDTIQLSYDWDYGYGQTGVMNTTYYEVSNIYWLSNGVANFTTLSNEFGEFDCTVSGS
jgi:hypothetical protein